MNVSTCLEGARELIAKPGGWCKQSFARDKKGRRADAESYSACSFCIDGAVTRASREDDAVYYAAIALLNCQIPGSGIWTFNDAPERTQEEVVAFFDRAIESAKAREASS